MYNSAISTIWIALSNELNFVKNDLSHLVDNTNECATSHNANLCQTHSRMYTKCSLNSGCWFESKGKQKEKKNSEFPSKEIFHFENETMRQ